MTSESATEQQIEKAKVVEKKSAARIKKLEKEMAKTKDAIKLLKAGAKAAKAFNKKGEGTKDQNSAITKAHSKLDLPPKGMILRKPTSSSRPLNLTKTRNQLNKVLSKGSPKRKQNMKGKPRIGGSSPTLTPKQEAVSEAADSNWEEISAKYKERALSIAGFSTYSDFFNFKKLALISNMKCNKLLDILEAF